MDYKCHLKVPPSPPKISWHGVKKQQQGHFQNPNILFSNHKVSANILYSWENEYQLGSGTTCGLRAVTSRLLTGQKVNK